MSDERNDKHRKPDFYVQLEIKGANGKRHLTDVAGLWEGNKGYKTGDSLWGRMVVQPRSQREELQKMRAEKAAAEDQAPRPDHEPKP